MGGTIRTRDAIQAGIHPRTLYQLRDFGELELLSRGVYRLIDQDQMSDPDLVIVAKRVPQSVICLVSALAYHERSEEHTSELQSRENLVCRLLLEKKK